MKHTHFSPNSCVLPPKQPWKFALKFNRRNKLGGKKISWLLFAAPTLLSHENRATGVQVDTKNGEFVAENCHQFGRCEQLPAISFVCYHGECLYDNFMAKFISQLSLVVNWIVNWKWFLFFSTIHFFLPTFEFVSVEKREIFAIFLA